MFLGRLKRLFAAPGEDTVSSPDLIDTLGGAGAAPANAVSEARPFGQAYVSDLAAADPFLRDLVNLLQENPKPASWPPISSVGASQDVAVMTTDETRVLHFNDEGVVSAAAPLVSGTPGLSLELSGLPTTGTPGGPPQQGGRQSYTSDLTSADPFLTDLLELVQENPNPASWPPLSSISGAQDAVIMTGEGVQVRHFDDDGVVSSAAAPDAMTAGLGNDGVVFSPAAPDTGTPGLPAAPNTPAGPGYISDFTSADPFLADLLQLVQENPDPASWPPISSINGSQDVAVMMGGGTQVLHFNAEGVLFPA